MAQPGAGDLDAENLARVGHDEVPDPLGQRRLPPWHWMLSTQGLLQGAPFGVREAHEHALVTGKRFRGPAAACHEISDIMIS
jgi:hypothetical protein